MLLTYIFIDVLESYEELFPIGRTHFHPCLRVNLEVKTASLRTAFQSFECVVVGVLSSFGPSA